MKRRDQLSAALLCAALLGCQHSAPAAPTNQLPPLAPPPPEQVVATVGGQPISVAQVEAQARATHASPQEALEALIRGEILAQEAAARGLVSHSAVQKAQKQEMVRRYLKQTFETEVTAQRAVPEDIMLRSYERNKPRLVHPDVRLVQHLLIHGGDPAKEPQAVALMQELQRVAALTKTTEEFSQLITTYRPKAQAIGWSLEVQMGPTSRQGMTVEEFAKAAFELKKIGEVSPVVKTSFGYHVLRYVSLTPAENVTYEQAKDKIRQGLWPEVQTRAFADLMEKLSKDHRSATYPERLAALQEAEQSQP